MRPGRQAVGALVPPCLPGAVGSNEPSQPGSESEPDPSVSGPAARRPPAIAGYVLHTLMGRGGHGEVWLGENRTTRRQVAVKFLYSRAALDWSLLDGETEKLAFLAADRRVVQLLDVGRDADPPFFVMEYISRGSLAQHLESAGRPELDRTVAIFEEIALGLMQVHAKGILHCDLKPSNILLDDELRPRLADFGQSRLSDQRSPGLSLGTMFFMAPEQADPAAVPDARWDIYALGAVLYSMLEGQPPHRTDERVAALRAEPDLARRLARYRQIVTSGAAPLPAVRGLDRPLREILARCLATDPRARFSTVKEIVEALRRRREASARRPIVLLGGVGPLLLLAVMAVFGVRGYHETTRRSSDAIRRRAFESDRFAAAFIARSLEGEVRRYFDIVAEEAARPEFRSLFGAVVRLPEGQRLAAAGPDRDAALIEAYLAHPARRALDAHFRERLDLRLAEARRDPKAPRFGSLFALDVRGTHVGAAYSDADLQTKSVGRYFAWRSYFHGGPKDLPRDTPRDQITPIGQAHLSAAFRSTTTRGWRVGVAIPLRDGPTESFGGVLVFTVDVGQFDFLMPGAQEQPMGDRFAVLVDARGGQGNGRILFHPYFGDGRAVSPTDPTNATPPLIDVELLKRMTWDWQLAYRDPLGLVPAGTAYRGSWIAAAQQLQLPGEAPAAADPGGSPGLVVVVQERADAATGPVERLGRRLVTDGVLALVTIGLTVAGLWFFALRGRARRDRTETSPAPASSGPRPLRDRSTLSEASADHG
jgi:eukaryotic-like serine/threonine-protein kinase